MYSHSLLQINHDVLHFHSFLIHEYQVRVLHDDALQRRT